MTKIRLAVLAMAVLFVGAATVSAQTTVGANTTRACSLLPGYTMADVVETARNFEWADDTAPGLVVINSKVAATGGLEFDFLVNFYWPSFSDMVEKQSRWIQSQGGAYPSPAFEGMATCGENMRMSSIRRATDPLPTGSSIAPVTAMMTTNCELNGTSFDDVMAGAKTLGDNFGALALVTRRNFGGPRIPFNSTVGMRFVFPSFDDFGEGMDKINQNPVPVAQNGPGSMSCETGSLWAAYRIHSRNN